MRVESETDPAERPANNLTGLAALANLATRLGIDLNVEQLRRRFSLAAEEPSSDELVAMAKDLGLEAQILHVVFADLPSMSKTLPAILRAKDGTALILEDARSDPMKGAVAVVRDPLSTEDAIALIEEDQLAEVWEGEIILIKRILGLTDELQPFGFSWLVGQVLREKALFRDIGIGSLINTVFAIVPAFMMMMILDRVITNHSVSTLKVVTGAIAIMIVFETVVGYLRRYLVQIVTTRIDARLNLYLIERLLKLPMDYFEHNPTGITLGKLAQIWKIRHFMTGQLFGAFLDAVPLIGILPAILILEWRLAVLTITLTCIIFLILYFYMPAIGRAQAKVIAAERRKGAHLVETIYGMKTIKSMALEGRRRKEWDRRVAVSAQAQHDFGMIGNHPQTLSLPFERLLYSGVLLVGAAIAISAPASLNAGVLVAFTMLSTRLAAPLLQIVKMQLDLGEVKTAIAEVASIMNSPQEENRPNGLKMPIAGEITFQDVRFRYSPTAPYALDGVNFTVPKGTMLGIMGRSGSGKTTVTRLLQRLNSSYEGMIKIDGMDLREVDLTHLRTHIGVVPQENFLFSGTIRENIAMAKPDASFMDVVRAAQLSGAEEFIERLPRGYDTVLEEGATNLSGGQRQRLAIARALLVNPPVLILDEATSALDAESEAIVNANLRRIAKGRTVLSISHRLSMLVEADAILVLERGKVYDLGTHEELLARCDIYRNMWYQQNRHADPKRHEAPVLLTKDRS